MCSQQGYSLKSVTDNSCLESRGRLAQVPPTHHWAPFPRLNLPFKAARDPETRNDVPMSTNACKCRVGALTDALRQPCHIPRRRLSNTLSSAM